MASHSSDTAASAGTVHFLPCGSWWLIGLLLLTALPGCGGDKGNVLKEPAVTAEKRDDYRKQMDEQMNSLKKGGAKKGGYPGQK